MKLGILERRLVVLSSNARFFFIALGLGLLASHRSPIAAQSMPRDGDGVVVYQKLSQQDWFIRSLAINKAQGILVTSGSRPSIRVWYSFDSPEKRERVDLNTPGTLVVSTAFVKLGKNSDYLVSGDNRGDIRVWDLDTAEEVGSFRAHDRAELYCLAYSMRDKVLVSSGSDQYVRFWDLETRREVKNLKAGLIDSISFSPDGKLLALANQSGELHVLAYPSLKTVWKMDKRISVGHAVDFAPDGNTIITPGAERFPNWKAAGLIHFWDSHSGASLGKISGIHSGEVQTGVQENLVTWGIRFAKYSPTGLLIASGGYDGKVFVCEVVTRQIVSVIPLAHRGGLSSVNFHAGDDKFVATGFDGAVFLCDLGKIKKPYRQSDDRNLLAKLDAHWDHLQSGDPLTGVVAVEFFLQHRKEGLAVLLEKTRNEKKPSQENLAKSIGELASTAPSVREKASRDLEKNLYHAEPLLRETLKNPKDLEQRRRIEGLLAKIPTLDGLKPAELRPLRVISILDRIATNESRDLLTWMSTESESAYVKSEAKRALK